MHFKLVFVAVLAVLFYSGSASDAQCPQGAVLSPFDPNTCYLFSSNATDYYSAADYCEDAGGHLSSVHSAFENSFFHGAASSSGADSFWIGASNNNFNGSWNWEDKTPFDWNDWGAGNALKFIFAKAHNEFLGQPNGTAGLCLYVRNHDGYWYGDACNQAKPFICKVNPSKQGLASCPNGWSFYSETKNCYKVSVAALQCRRVHQNKF